MPHMAEKLKSRKLIALAGMVLLVIGLMASGSVSIPEGLDYLFKTVLGYFGAQGLADAAGALTPALAKVRDP